MALHEDAIDYTCNLDVDLLKNMIPHHQGAIDTKVVLRYGTNPEIGQSRTIA